eukprot:3088888-Prorocentrum_lima.AAC.1
MPDAVMAAHCSVRESARKRWVSSDSLALIGQPHVRRHQRRCALSRLHCACRACKGTGVTSPF